MIPRKMKVIFIKLAEESILTGILGHPPVGTSSFPPLGLLYTAAILEQHNHSVKIIDGGQEVLTKESLTAALASADVIGLSVYTNNYQHTAEFAAIIKNIKPDIPIIIGGPHCIFRKHLALNDIPGADICVDAESETVIADLVEALQGKKQFADLPGVHYRQGTSVHSGRPSQVVKNLDVLPFPARHLIDHYDYGNLPFGTQYKKKFTSVITSRGCAFRCRFCAKYGNCIPGFDFRQRSAENVVKELHELKDHYRTISIVDDNFLADRKRSHKIFDMLLSSGTTLDMFIVGARVDTAEQALYEKMKKVGVKYISYGIESGNQDVLDYYHKNVTLKQIRKGVQLAQKMGFFVNSTFIFGAPIETKEHLERTTKFLCSLPLDTVTIWPFSYDLGGELHTQAVRDGNISEDEWEVRADVNRQLGILPIKEVDEAIQHAYRRFYFRPSYAFGQVYRALKQRDFARLRDTFRVLISSQMKNIL